MKSLVLLLGLVLFGAAAPAQTLTQIRDTGPRANRVNLLFVSEGYTAAEQTLFEQHVAARIPGLLADDAWRRFANYVNIFRLFVPSQESGLDIVDENIYRNTAFDSYISNTGPWGFSTQKLDAAALAALPEYDAVILFVNTSHSGQTAAVGNRIFMLVPTGPGVDNAALDDVLLHELGHAFAGLADEYWDMAHPYTGPASVLVKPNASSETDRDRVPWSRFIFPATPVPTETAPDENTVGVFQGAALRSTFTRPTYNSKMRASKRPWGPVNLRAFATAIHRLNLNQATVPPAITQQPTGAVVARGSRVTLSVQATGVGPVTYHWMRDGVYLPDSLDPTYTIPAVDDTTAGTYQVEVINGAGSTLSADAPVTVQSTAPAAPVIQQVPDQDMSYHPAYNIGYYGYILFGASGSPTSITATGVPDGVTFYPTNPISGSGPGFVWMGEASPGGRTGGEIPGGEYNVTVTATNDAGTGTMSFRWVVHPGIVGYITPDKANYVVGDTIHLRATFSAPVVVAGTPSVTLWGSERADYVSGSGTTILVFDHTVTAADGYVSAFDPDTIVLNGGAIATPGGTAATLSEHGSIGLPYGPKLNIIAPDPVIDNVRISATVGDAVSTRIVATNAAQFAIVNGTLPPGLSLDAATGRVTGTPTQDGTWPTTVQVSNSAGQTASATVTFVVYPRASIQDQTFYATVGAPFSAQIVATNATKYSIIANIPPLWLHLDDSTGVISGTPTIAGTVDLTISVDSQASAQVHIIVTDATQPPPPPPPPLPTQSSQTITFNSPVSAVVIGQPITLGATSSAGLEITYTVVSGEATISGNVLTPLSTAPLVVRAASAGNAAYAPAATDVAFGSPQKAGQAITADTTPRTVRADTSVVLSATTSSGLPVTYAVISGPAIVDGSTLTFTGTGTVVVRASQDGSDTVAPAEPLTFTYTAVPVNRLVNLSSRLRVTADPDRASIAGFVVSGAAPKQILIRAAGPALSQYGIASPLADPELRLFDGTGRRIATNAGWGDDAPIAAAAKAVGAFAFGPGSKDSALLVSLAPGNYTAQIASANSGIALIEVYDVAAGAAVPTRQLINLSTRAYVDTGDNVLVGGFVVAGADAKRVLIRAVGPGLGAFGVSGVLQDPVLKVYDANNEVVAQNDNWGTPVSANAAYVPVIGSEIASASSAAGAFALADGSADAAVVLTLPPGAYTAVVTGANGTTGSALVEVYELP